MTSASSYVLVAAGGAVGAALRYSVTQASLRWFGSGFPFGTLAVNVVGSLAMGALMAVVMSRGNEPLRLLLATGLLGGFTTFSAFSLDTLMLAQRGAMLAAGGYVVASVVLSLFGVWVGLWAGRAMLA